MYTSIWYIRIYNIYISPTHTTPSTKIPSKKKQLPCLSEIQSPTTTAKGHSWRFQETIRWQSGLPSLRKDMFLASTSLKKSTGFPSQVYNEILQIFFVGTLFTLQKFHDSHLFLQGFLVHWTRDSFRFSPTKRQGIPPDTNKYSLGWKAREVTAPWARHGKTGRLGDFAPVEVAVRARRWRSSPNQKSQKLFHPNTTPHPSHLKWKPLFRKSQSMPCSLHRFFWRPWHPALWRSRSFIFLPAVKSQIFTWPKRRCVKTH